MKPLPRRQGRRHHRRRRSELGCAQKGLKEGDVILKAGDATVSSPQELWAALKKAKDDGLNAVMLRVRSGEQTVLVAIPLNKS